MRRGIHHRPTSLAIVRLRRAAGRMRDGTNSEPCASNNDDNSPFDRSDVFAVSDDSNECRLFITRFIQNVKLMSLVESRNVSFVDVTPPPPRRSKLRSSRTIFPHLLPSVPTSPPMIHWLNGDADGDRASLA